MTVSRRQLAIAIGAVAALGLAVTGGYYQGKRQAKTVVETRVEYRDRVIEKTVYVKAKDVAKKTTTTTSQRPDGSSVTVKVEDLQTHTDLGTASMFTGTSAGTLTSRAETVTGSKAGWRLGVGADWKGVHSRPDAWSLELDRRLVGPFWLGAEVSTDKRAGLRLGVEF